MEKNNTFTQGKILMTLTNLVSSFAMGTTVLLGQQIGCGERKQGGRTVGTAIVMFTVIALVMTAVLVIFAPQVSSIMNAPEEAFDKTVAYVRICGGGMLVIVAYNLIGCIFRGIGDSRTPLYFLMVSSVVNILLDLLFVIKVQMGVAGVAWATLIAQAISACLVLIRLMTSTESYKLILKDIRFHKKVLLETVRIGLPGGIQNAVISFSNLIVQYNINSFGAAAVAGCRAYTKIDGFAILPVMSFSMAITTFTGQNIGAKNYDRVRKGAKTCLVIALAVTLTLSGGLYLFGEKLLRVFSSDQQVLSYAVQMMHFLVPGYVCLAVAHTYCGVVRGAGISMVPMLALVGNMCVLRVIWISLAMPVFHNIIVVFLGYSLTWLTSALTMVIYYHRSGWLERHQLQRVA